jgi:hypothetical protein
MKLLSQVKGQKVSVDKSSSWNYEINLEYIIRKEKEEQRKLYNKILPKEKEIKISELESEVEKLEKEFEENKENENVKKRLGELYDKLVTYYQKNDASKVTELLMKQSALE